MENNAVITTDLEDSLQLLSRGKVRDLYTVDNETLLFVATDRISAYDVVLKNVSGPLLDVPATPLLIVASW